MLINMVLALVQLASMASALTSCAGVATAAAAIAHNTTIFGAATAILDLNTTHTSGRVTPTFAMTKDVAHVDNSDTAFKAQIISLMLACAQRPWR
ncbi:hypothetical protein Q7P35_008610 [Cladosporium inversicolor]